MLVKQIDHQRIAQVTGTLIFTFKQKILSKVDVQSRVLRSLMFRK